MGFIDWMRNLFGVKQKPLDDGTVEQAFNVTPAASRVMKSNIELWYALYINQPPWKSDCVHSLGLPGAIGRELARYTMSEFTMTVSGGVRADYLNERAQNALVPLLMKAFEIGYCLGGVAIRPYIDQTGRLLYDLTGPTAFSPVEFDGTGKAVAGVFKDTAKVGKETYTRLEYHGFENGVYVIRNKAYKGETGGGTEISLATVPQWANLQNETKIEGIDRPLFAYFKNPTSNDIEPGSQIGVSIYGGEANIELLKQADKQWYQLIREYSSGKRRVLFNGSKLDASQVDDEIYEYGDFTGDGNFFQFINPEIRDEPYYNGFQKILQRIEYNVGLSFGTVSDPQSVEKTATEILAGKNRQRITVNGGQNAGQNALDDLMYATNAYCDLYRLAPAGDYEVTYNWGDGVLDDPDTIRQDKAMMLQEISAGITNQWEYRVAFKKESEEEAKAMLPQMEQIVTENQDEVE